MSSPSPHEKGIPPSGLTFDIQRPDLIYQAISQGKGGQIAAELLESPLRGLGIEIDSDGTTFDLTASISLAFDMDPSAINEHRLVEQAAYQLGQGDEVAERGGSYITQDEDGVSLVLSRGKGPSEVVISTGKAEDIFLGEVQLAPPLEVSEENIEKALKSITTAVSLITNIAYQHKGKASPDQTIAITPPKQKMGVHNNERAAGLIDKIEVERPNVTFSDIGGQEEAKREMEGLAFALSNPGLYKKWGTKPPKGILLYGPPGTGKTLMAKALASQAEARFFHVKTSDIGSKWYGESEQLVQQIFDAASENGKTIIYFDEVDSIVPDREGSHEATQRVIGTLLQNIDGLEANDNVMVVASTNRLKAIDPAMTRAGRLDRLVEVPLPDESGRSHILAIHLEKANTVADRKLFDKLDLDRITADTKDFSGADIAEIVRRTLEEKVRQEGRGEEPGLVTTEDLLRELQNYESVRKSKPAERVE